MKGSYQDDVYLSVTLMVPFLMSTCVIRYFVKDIRTDYMLRVLLLEVIAAAEMSACVNELPAGPATDDVGSMVIFILIWMALKWWLDTQWTVETPNPIIRMEDMVLGYISIGSLIVVIWIEIIGAVAGYSTMRMFRESIRQSPGCVSPLKVSVWEGMLLKFCGTLVCRLVAHVFSMPDSRNHQFINYATEITIILTGAKYTGGNYNPLPISGMYYFCQDMMPMHCFLLVYWVAAIAACFMAILIAPAIRILFGIDFVRRR